MDIEKAGGTYIVSYDDVEVRFSNISSSSDNILAFVRVFLKIPVRKQIATAKLNLLAPRSISDLSKRLNDTHPNDWSQILQVSCTKVIEDFLSPPTPDQLTLTPKTYPTFLINQFILGQSPTLWFAPGGSGKSFLALALAMCAENGWDFFGECQPAHTLYLDWETDLAETSRRATLLVGGLSQIYEVRKEEIKLPSYMRMYLPLVDSVEGLIETTFNLGFKFVIIDSVAPALGSDLISAAEVTKFFSAIRRLNAEGVTTLLITHVSKGDKKDGDNKRTPFGSVFFENFPRLTWELRSEFDEQKNAFLFGLFCRKSNIGKLQPKGYSLTFHSDYVEIGYVDPEETEVSDEKQTLAEMILALLEERSMTVKEMADILQAIPGSVRTVLNRLKNRGLITTTPTGAWT